MKEQDRWIELMKYGERLGCHQRPERSFFIKSYQMPVCARCTGVMVGHLLALPLFLLYGHSWLISLAGCSWVIVDWGLQALKLKESTNVRRIITGLVGGYGLMSVQLWLISVIISCIGKKA